MPVRDCERFIDAAVASILTQDLADLEFVILDDASSDGTSEKLLRWTRSDPRIRLLRSERPLGLVGSSQRVMAEARAPFVARMDGDDISRPDRLRVQERMLRDDPDAVLAASLARGLDENGRVVRPIDLRRLRPGATSSPGPHSSWMFRRDAFDRSGGYLDGTEGWEDTSLLHRLIALGRVLVAPEPLIDYRYHAVGATVTHPQPARELVMVAHAREFGPDGHGGTDVSFAPDAYRMRAGMRVWAGYRPDVDARFPRIGSHRWLRRSLPVLAYATWGRAAPRSMRATMASLISARNRLYRVELEPGRPVVWINV